MITVPLSKERLCKAQIATAMTSSRGSKDEKESPCP